MKNLESNKLIAEFMGLEIITDGISWFDKKFKSLKKYHESWDCLMSVVEKIETFECNGEKYILESVGNGAKFILEYGTRPFNDCICETKIESVYKAVLEFINWHNENK